MPSALKAWKGSVTFIVQYFLWLVSPRGSTLQLYHQLVVLLYSNQYSSSPSINSTVLLAYTGNVTKVYTVLVFSSLSVIRHHLIWYAIHVWQSLTIQEEEDSTFSNALQYKINQSNTFNKSYNIFITFNNTKPDKSIRINLN